MLTAAMLLVTTLSPAAPAVAISVSGAVQVEAGGGNHALRRFEAVPEGAIVTTGEDGMAQLRLGSGSLVRLGAGTRVSLRQLEHGTPRGSRKEGVKLWAGRLWLSVTRLFGSDSRFEVETENAVAGVRGTSFIVESDGGRDRFLLAEGSLAVKRGDAEQRLDAPGSFVDAGQEGFGAGGRLDAAALAAVQRKIGGAAASLVARLAGRLPAPAGAAAIDRRRARTDILSPRNVLDTPLPIEFGPSSAPIDADVLVRVRIRED